MTIEDHIRTSEQLTGSRASWDSWWESLMDHFLPSRSYRGRAAGDAPAATTFDRIYDTTGMEACEGLANMLTSRLTPVGERWVSYSPPSPFDQDEEITAWYRECSNIILKELLSSNYYTERAEANLDKAGLGTSCLYVQRGKNRLFHHKHIDLGTFNFREDEEGMPSEFYYEPEMTAYEIKAKFPAPLPEKIAAACANNEEKHTKKFKILHYVGPNPDYNDQKLESKYKKFISRWISLEDKKDLDIKGFDAFPYEVSRMQKWTSVDQWGLAPGRKAMPDIHQANWLQHLSDLAAELIIRPRTLTLANQVGQINYRSGGSTVVTAEAAAAGLPKEWLHNGRPDFAEARLTTKQDSIKRMFLQPLWQPYSEITRDVTAYEVSARERQSLTQAVPILARHETDSQPIHARYFGIALQAGILPPVPRKLVEQTGPDIPDPIARSESRIAKMIRDSENQDFAEFAEQLAGVAQLSPDVLDEIDLAAGIREVAKSRNLPAGTIRDEQAVIELRSSREQQQEQAGAMEAMDMGAGAAQKASQVDPAALQELAGLTA